jgi:hypothetical protein
MIKTNNRFSLLEDNENRITMIVTKITPSLNIKKIQINDFNLDILIKNKKKNKKNLQKQNILCISIKKQIECKYGKNCLFKHSLKEIDCLNNIN